MARWTAAVMAAALVSLEAQSAPSPIIGMFSLPVESYDQPESRLRNAGSPKRPCPEGYACELLPASYVKFVEAAGGRVVPISTQASDEEALHLARSLNGFLFTGGPDVEVPRAAALIMNYSRAQQRTGVAGASLPIWGTCLGFEWILNHTAPGSLEVGVYDAWDLSLPLALTKTAKTSRFLGRAPEYIISALANKNLTFNNHHNGINPRRFANHVALAETMQVLSTSVDRKGKEFVSALEGRDGLPWFGVQWHPEKAAFEHGFKKDGAPFERIPHDPEAVAIEQYVANFFLDLARKNAQRFADRVEEGERLIYGRPTSTDQSPEFVEVYYLNYPLKGGPAVRSYPGQPVLV